MCTSLYTYCHAICFCLIGGDQRHIRLPNQLQAGFWKSWWCCAMLQLTQCMIVHLRSRVSWASSARSGNKLTTNCEVSQEPASMTHSTSYKNTSGPPWGPSWWVWHGVGLWKLLQLLLKFMLAVSGFKVIVNPLPGPGTESGSGAPALDTVQWEPEVGFGECKARVWATTNRGYDSITVLFP